MPIDAGAAIGATLPEQRFEWDASDVIGYHLAIGAGRKPTSSRELKYFLERELCVLPTFATTSPATFGVAAPAFYHSEPPEIRYSGLELSLANLLQNHLELTIYRPFSRSGTAVAQSRITDIYDQGRNALLLQEAIIIDSSGPLCDIKSSIFLRGEGGFGGKRPPLGGSNRIAMPPSNPDITIDIPTMPQQALLYQLCGESNPMHSDPEYAKKSGFPRPILQGACTYGMLFKSIVDEIFNGEVNSITQYSTRFSGVVFPGETIQVQIWRQGVDVLFVASTRERPDLPVLTDGIVRIKHGLSS